MIRILHISDLHATAGGSAQGADQTELLEAFLTDVAKERQSGPFDLVVMSGDLSFSGQKEELERALQTLLDPLLDRLALEPAQLVITPGNHDVDRSAIDPDLELGYGAGLRDRDAVNTLMADPARLQHATARLGHWTAFQAEFLSAANVQEIAPLGVLHQIEAEDGSSIAVASLNSAWRSSGDLDRAQLLLGDQQVGGGSGGDSRC